jgi:hypothetical protein
MIVKSSGVNMLIILADALMVAVGQNPFHDRQDHPENQRRWSPGAPLSADETPQRPGNVAPERRKSFWR